MNRFRVTVLFVVLGLCSVCTAQHEPPAPYAAKPAWWDTVQGDGPGDTDQPAQALTDAVRREEQQWAVPDGGFVLGPLHGASSLSLSLPLAADSHPPDLTATYPGRAGAEVGWQQWGKGEPCPVELGKGPGLFYALLEVELQAAGTRYFSFMSRNANVVVWLDGTVVLRDARRVHRGDDRPQVVPLSLQAGKHTILAKFHLPVDGTASLCCRVTAEHPLWRAVKLRSWLTTFLTAADTLSYRCAVFEALTKDYLALGDPRNATHWALQTCLHVGDAGRIVNQVQVIVRQESSLGAYSDVEPFLRQVALAGDVVPAKGRVEAARELVELYKRSLKYDRMLRFLEEHEQVLVELVPKAHAVAMVHATARLGKRSAAHEALARAYERVPKLRKDYRFKHEAAAVNGLRGQPAKVAVDYEFEDRIRDAEQLARGKSRRPLLRFIREVLSSKNMHLLETDDPDSFVPAHRAYRRQFARYADIYAPYIRKYLSLFGKSSNVSADALLRRSQQLALAAPGTRQRQPGAGGTRIPSRGVELDVARLVAPDSVGHLSYSALELAALDEASRYRIQPRVQGAMVTDGDWAYAQSSRHLAAFRDGTMVWQHRVPNSVYTRGDGRTPSGVLFKGSSAAAAGGSVYARLFEKGAFSLFAFERESGRMLWRYRDDGHVLCSDPALWRDSLVVVAKRRAGLSDYVLLILDGKTGRLEEELYLYSATEKVPFNARFSETVILDEFLPAPSVSGGVAFVSADSGVVLAVDLARSSINWLRRYTRMPFRASRELSQLGYQRRRCSPLLTAHGVVFAPSDCAELLLVDPVSGQLRARSIDLHWQDACALGPDHVAVIGADSRFLSVISLPDMTVSATLRSEERWRLAGPAGRWAVVQDGAVVTRLGADGVFERGPPLPEGVRLMSWAPSGVFGCVSGAVSFRVVRFGGAPRPRAGPASPAEPAEPATDYLVAPRLQTAGGRSYVVAANCIAALDEGLKQRWSCPIRWRPRALFEVSGELFAVFRGHWRVLDPDTGALIRTFAGIGGRYGDITACRPCDGGVVCSIQHEWVSSSVLRWERGEPEILGRVDDASHVSAILGKGERVIGHKSHKAVVFDRDLKGGVYTKTALSHSGETSQFMDNGKAVVIVPHHHAALFDGTAFRSIEMAKGEGEWRRFPPVAERSVYTCRLFRYFWTAIDASSGLDLSRLAPFVHPPLVTDRHVFGIVWSNEGEPFAAARLDRRAPRAEQKVSVPLRALGSLSRYGHNRIVVEFVLRKKDRVYYLVKPGPDRAASLERVLIAQDMKTGAVEVRRVPGYRTGAAAVAGEGDVLLFIDDSTLHLDEATFARWLNPQPAIAGALSKEFAFVPDGFADEWPPALFSGQGRNAVTAVLAEDRIHVGILLQDAQLIEAIGERGVDERLELFVCCGSMLGVNPAQEPGGYRGALDGAGVKGWIMAYHAAPTGDRFFIELSFPAESVLGVPISHLVRLEARAALGDIAVNLVLRDDDGAVRPVFAEPGDRLGVPRICFRK